MKRALIYDPYLDTLGGGERYALSFANSLADVGISVDLAWDKKEVLASASKRFGQDYSQINISETAFQKCQKGSLFEKIQYQRQYDIIFWVSDGSFPFLFAKKNYLHFQVPFVDFAQTDKLKWLKNLFISKYICNSQFTQANYSHNLPRKKLTVLYPPVDTKNMSKGKKENWIISVARFDSPLHHKRQDILIDAFRKLSLEFNNYKLILAGGLKDKQSISDLIKHSKGLNIDFIVNPDFSTLKDLYSKSRFFWHAAGFGVDELKNPEKVEHFGMTTVEAMASGCVPIVIKKGGQKEIIVDGQNGFLCETSEDLANRTADLLHDSAKRLKFKKQSMLTAERFSLQQFKNGVMKIISR